MTLPLLALVFGAPDDPAGGGRSGWRALSDAKRAPDAVVQREQHDPDRSVLTQLRAGDAGAVDVLVATYYTNLVAFAASITGDVPSAEDVVQDAFVAVWERRTTLTVRTTVAAYLFTAVRNTALNARRSAQRDRRWAEMRFEHSFEGSLSADRALEQQEREQLLRVALAGLAPRYREVLTLRANGLTYDAIADVLNLPVKTARTRGLRGIGMLRAALEGRV